MNDNIVRFNLHTQSIKYLKIMKTFMLAQLCMFLILGTVFAKDSSKETIPLIGSKAPSFKTESTNGKIDFPKDFGDNWKILFSHPKDFTPVCSSEILELANLQPEFKKLGVKIAIISTDDVHTHVQWKAHLEELNYKNRGQLKINFPLLDDEDAKISQAYGMLHKPISTTKDVRGVFIIDPDNVVRSINFYPMQVGRNMDEIVRIVEALQATSKEKIVTPANWTLGDDVMVPYFPYTKGQLRENPDLKNNFYNVGSKMWFRKGEI